MPIHSVWRVSTKRRKVSIRANGATTHKEKLGEEEEPKTKRIAKPPHSTRPAAARLLGSPLLLRTVEYPARTPAGVTWAV